MGTEYACCEDCRQTLAGKCPVHGPLLKVQDSCEIFHHKSPTNFTSLTHAKDILDHGFLEQSSSSGVGITYDKCQPCVKDKTVLQLQDKNNNNVSTSSCEPWKCSNCNKMFGTFLLLEQHSCQSKRTKQGSKSLFNKILKTPVTSQANHDTNACQVTTNDKYDTHIADVKESIPGSSKLRIVKESVTFTCHLCSKVFLNHDKLKTHSYMHTGERPYTCTNTECTKAFISKYKLLRHMTTHSPMKVHLCSYCDKKFHRKDHLKNHLQTHDPNKIAYRCAECGKMYNTKPGYKKHVALHAAASGELNCKICDKDFLNTESLLEHIKLHSGKSNGTKEKKHRCEHCGRQFYTRKDVRRHMVVHTGRKDFLCQICGQRFGRKDHLVRHTRKSHDSSNQLRVKLGEHLHAAGSETVQQMLEKQQRRAQHLRSSAKPTPPPSNKLTDLLKIPSVALPKLFHNEAVKKHAPAKSAIQAVLLDKGESSVESGSVEVKGICVPGNSLYAGELGEIWRFVSLAHQTPITTAPQPSTTASLETPSTPGAVHQQHQPEFQQGNHQQQAQQLQQHLQQPPQQQPQPQAMHYFPTADLSSSSSHINSFTNVVQAPFTGLQSSLPGFHQAFQ